MGRLGTEPVALAAVVAVEGAVAAVWVRAPEALVLALAVVGLIALVRAGAEPRRPWSYPAVTLGVLLGLVLAVRVEAGVRAGESLGVPPFTTLAALLPPADTVLLFGPTLTALAIVAVVAAVQLLAAFTTWDRDVVVRSAVLPLALPLLLAGLLGPSAVVVAAAFVYPLAYGLVHRWRPAVPTL